MSEHDDGSNRQAERMAVDLFAAVHGFAPWEVTPKEWGKLLAAVRERFGRCPCCGERYTPAPDEIAMQCACENENCDENCPHVGHLFR